MSHGPQGMGRRKLLFYTHALVGGGAERVWARLASGFSARGDDVVFVVDFEAKDNAAFLDRSVDLRVLPRGHARATLALSRMLAREKPDASLSALSVSNLKHTIAARLARRADRAILSYHGFYESEPERLSNIGYRATRLLTRSSAATVAVSHALRRELVERFAAPPARTRVIYNPAQPEPAPAPVTKEDLTNRAPVVLAIGRLVADKDFETLIAAFAGLRTPQARLVILGEGPLRARLEQTARALGVDGRVSMPGYVAAPAEAFEAARVFALASRRESFGLASVEALAHGLPVVATDCGGPGEIVVAPACGRIVAVGDAAAIADSLDALLADPGEPGPRQRRARDFSLEAALEGYDALIESVIRHGPAPT
ncbi:MAG: glycosyltransferase [Hyphomicrobiales bacterium]|nr:glycosyltransferase [Hyphomicrobiales bacterium]